MRIQGLQKLTLLDYPGKVACTVFTAGCNFRCPFCHNASLVTRMEENEDISEKEFFGFLEKRQGILDGVCVTGGEPLIWDDIRSFLERIKDLGYLVKLDTNGSFPGKLKQLIRANVVDYVAMDIKNSKEKYAQTIGIEDYDISNIEESIAILKQGLIPYEFRTTMVREFHQKADIEDIGRWICGASRYYLQAFKDSGDLIQEGLHGYDKRIMDAAAQIVGAYIEDTAVRGIE
ncbi:MAG: anaerobic ribonucleoside-triphosphate reductase activating protein [Lachnospiraceae bacterium]|nr:anaerobic ribonucleoside-triphosphate reductase activating protein [Lachnospiraceae bacterium]